LRRIEDRRSRKEENEMEWNETRVPIIVIVIDATGIPPDEKEEEN